MRPFFDLQQILKSWAVDTACTICGDDYPANPRNEVAPAAITYRKSPRKETLPASVQFSTWNPKDPSVPGPK